MMDSASGLNRQVLGDRPSTLRDPFACDIVFVDVETSGLVAEYHDIIEVGALRVHQPSLDIVQEYSTKVRMVHPERAEAEALRVNGYSEERWMDAVPLSTAMLNVWRMLDRSVLCAHKATFDDAFLYFAMKRCAYLLYDQPAPWFYVLDTLSNAQLVLRGIAPRLRGSLVAEAIGIPPEPEPHTALNGARQCYEIYRRQRELIDDPIIAARIRELTKISTTV